MTSSLLDVERVGCQTPRVANYPPYSFTEGPEVIEFARLAGLVLDEWQQYVLNHALGVRANGDWTAKKAACWVPRQNGKGAIIEALELFWLFELEEELIVHSAHQHRTSQRAYRRLEKIIKRVPELHRRVVQYRHTNGEQGVVLHDGRELQYTTRSRTAIRGFSAGKIVLDEAQELDQDQMSAILPAVSAMPNWQVWFFGTPPDNPAAWCYGLKEDGEAGIARLAHFDWGSELNPDDPDYQQRCAERERWYRHNPALGIRIDEETVEDEYKPSGLGVKFGQERLGAWKPRARRGAGVIATELWRDLVVAAERPASVAMAIVVNHKRTHTAIASVGPRVDGRLQVSIVDHRPGTHWVVARAMQIHERWKPVGWAVQDKGPSGTLIAPLEAAGLVQPEDRDEPRRGQLAVPWSNDVAVAYGMTIDAVTERRLVHLDEGPLNLAVAGAETRPLGGGTTWDYKVDGAEVIQAATLAHWLYVTWAPLITRPYDPLANIW